ncbi:hypothetical protein ACQ4LE_006786, partial [Meloidogyne hapla]
MNKLLLKITTFYAKNLKFNLIIFLIIFLLFIKITKTVNLNEEEKEEQRRHSLSLLEPDFAENIFKREGSKNPIKRTTTIPLINRQEGINNKDQKKSKESTPKKPKKRQILNSRYVRSPNEYDELNQDFLNEYDALNLDFNLDDEKEENKKLEVLNREFIWQNKENEQQITQEFPPKEWWDGEEINDDLENIKENNGTEKIIIVKKRRHHRSAPKKYPKRTLHFSSDDYQRDEQPVEAIDRDKLLIIPKLIPSKATLPQTTTIIKTTTFKTPLKIGDSKIRNPPSPPFAKKLAKKPVEQQQKQIKQKEEFQRDLPNLLISSSSNLSENKKSLKTNKLEKEEKVKYSQQTLNKTKLENKLEDQVLNVGGINEEESTKQEIKTFNNVEKEEKKQNQPDNVFRNNNSPLAHLLPNGFVHIATLNSPPPKIGQSQIIVDGQKYWVEKTISLSQFNGEQQINFDKNNNKRPESEQLPMLISFPPPLLIDQVGSGGIQQQGSERTQLESMQQNNKNILPNNLKSSDQKTLRIANSAVSSNVFIPLPEQQKSSPFISS